MPKKKLSVKECILNEIDSLKRRKPENWQRDARRLIRELQWHLRDEDFRETHVNSEIRGHEMVGRKCRSTKISPPF